MEQTFVLFVASVVMLSHVAAFISSLMIIRRYEERIKNLCFFSLFDRRDFVAQKLWFALLAIFTSVGYLSYSAELFIQLNNAFTSIYTLKYVLLNLAVSVLIIQVNYFMLTDRRGQKENKRSAIVK